ncbi:Uncharacterized protein dnl_62160 [Desulfonema limicola]|uniref:Uncharacterized protein n=1 Tax=Desulfonema limicola TaxID=45656 RepID=A0A975BEU0_9BACT|nr:hypothetical protein [Desulfonema limicola]QTA83800.1 Uncharacterized protein dnl_62160 [Desulfonema limicola]
MISEKIKKDVTDEFANLKEALQTHLKPGFDVSQTKQFLQAHIPKEIVYKSEILLDTLLNYLMEDARERIKSADVNLQNAFFDADFRKRLHEWTKQLKNKLAIEPNIVKYTSDPRLKQGLIASGITFVVGTGITAALAPIFAGIVTIVLTAFAFKFAYEKAAPKAREIIKMDIDHFLTASQRQVVEWLEKVETAFENDFSGFCAKNGFELKGKLNG